MLFRKKISKVDSLHKLFNIELELSKAKDYLNTAEYERLKDIVDALKNEITNG